jgi:ParB/RepB/Spo0J family partition protein
MKYPDEDSTDPAVLEKLGVEKPKTQAQREAAMKEDEKKKPESFTDQLAVAMGAKSPEQRKEDAEHQLELIASHLPPSLGMQTIHLSDLRPSPTNPRKRKGNIDDLIKSIEKLGVLQPPLVRAVAGKGGFETIFGHERIRAAKEAGLDELLCDVRDLTDNEVLEAQAVENSQRTDLHPLEEAEHYGLMMKAGYAAETIAAKIGKSSGWIHGRIKLLNLCAEGRTALYDGENGGGIHASVGIPLARIYPSDQQAKALHYLLRNPMTARQMVEYLQKEFAQSLKGTPFDPKDETLVEAAGSCIACPYNANNMPPTLFGDVEKGLEKQGLCLNTTCFGTKCRAQTARMLAKAKDSGAEVLSASETRTVLQATGALQYKADYVKADDVVQQDRQKRSWAQIFDKLEPEDKPAMTVAPDPAQPGKTVKLFDRKEAMKAARDMGLKWAQTAGSASKSPEEKAESKASREKQRAASLKQEAVLTVTKLTIPRLAAAWSKKAGLAEMRAVAAEAFAKRKGFNPEDSEIILSGFDIPGAKDGKVPTERAVEKWIEDGANLNELIALTCILLKYETWIDTADEFEPGFADFAAAAGANLKEGVRAQQLEASLAAEKKGKVKA